MNKYLKIGIISGVLAGFVSAIIVILAGIVQSSVFDLGFAAFVVTPVVPLSVVASVEIVYGLIFGIFLGAIYCKIYNVIPRKSIVKALLFGLFLYAMLNLRFATISGAYGRLPIVTAFIFFGIYGWLPFSIILGISYEFLRKRYSISNEPKVTQYSMSSALIPSGIAALLGGMATFGTILIAVGTGFWEWIPGQMSDIEFLISQFGSQTFFHFVWCTIFGLFYPKVYNLMPGKDVIKGVVYGLIGLIITEGRFIGYTIVNAPYFEAHGLHEIAHMLRFDTEQMALLGSTVWIVFGLVLGLLYRKPSE